MTADHAKAERVFCRDCANLCKVGETVIGELRLHTIYTDGCRIADVTFDPVRGEVRRASDPKKRNANFDCPHFTPRGAERIRPSEPEKKPWWRFW